MHYRNFVYICKATIDPWINWSSTLAMQLKIFFIITLLKCQKRVKNAHCISWRPVCHHKIACFIWPQVRNSKIILPIESWTHWIVWHFCLKKSIIKISDGYYSVDWLIISALIHTANEGALFLVNAVTSSHLNPVQPTGGLGCKHAKTQQWHTKLEIVHSFEVWKSLIRWMLCVWHRDSGGMLWSCLVSLVSDHLLLKALVILAPPVYITSGVD